MKRSPFTETNNDTPIFDLYTFEFADLEDTFTLVFVKDEIFVEIFLFCCRCKVDVFASITESGDETEIEDVCEVVVRYETYNVHCMWCTSLVLSGGTE